MQRYLFLNEALEGTEYKQTEQQQQKQQITLIHEIHMFQGLIYGLSRLNTVQIFFLCSERKSFPGLRRIVTTFCDFKSELEHKITSSIMEQNLTLILSCHVLHNFKCAVTFYLM